MSIPWLKSLAVLVTSIGLSILSAQLASAVEQETLILLTDPLSLPQDWQALQEGTLPEDGSVITANTISQTELTIPSLWWAQDQFGGKLLNNWLAYPGTNGSPRRVDLIVNQQVWSLYNYLERYTFVTQFGTTARDYDYNVRIFNQDQNLLAAYICEAPPTAEAAPACNVFLNSGGTGALQGRSSSFGGFQPINGGTVQP